MADKSYKSYRQQIDILRSRGMVIGKGSQSSRVMSILERENYYNVINGYKELFLASKATATIDEIYKTGTTFDEIYALYNFDRDSRSDLNDFISFMRTAFDKLQKQLHTISATDIMSIMGYDTNWTNLANLTW